MAKYPYPSGIEPLLMARPDTSMRPQFIKQKTNPGEDREKRH